MAQDYEDFLKGFEEEDFGMEAVSAEELSDKIVAPSQATEVLESNVQGITNLESKIDKIISGVNGINALLDFDELNIESKLDQILDHVDSVKSAAPAEVNAVVEESTETKEKLDKIMAAIGDPEKRKAEVERRLAEAIENREAEVDGKLNIRITNEANEAVNKEAFGYSDLTLIQCEINQNYDPFNKKCCHKDCDPVSCTGPKKW